MSLLDTELMIKKLTKLIGRPLFEDERAMVYKWYDTWDFDRDAILYAFDITINRITHTSQYIRYMDAVLQSWKDGGLNSLDEIKASVGQKENVKVTYRNVQRHVLFEREPVYIRYGLADVKPCPFCGSYDIVVKNQFSSNHNAFFSLAECFVCGANTRARINTAMAKPEDQEFWETDSVKEVIRLWNTRV